MSVVTVVPTVEPSTGVDDPPRVRLNVTDVGTSPAITSTTVTRLDPDGRTVVVRTFDGNPLVLSTSGADRVGLVYDYELPFSAPVQYSTLESPAVVSAPVTVAESKVWLVHPGVPGLSRPITVARFGDRSRKIARGVFYPLGRTTPVVQTDGARKSAEYDLTVVTLTEQEHADFEALLEDASPLLLNIPATKGWGRPTEYIAVGDIQETAASRMAGELVRTWSLPCTVVDRPVGGSQSERTYVDLLAFATYADLQAAYPTYAALLAGP